MKIENNQEQGAFGIVQVQPNGTIKQVGLTESQYHVFKLMILQFSEKSPLPLLPKEYDLQHVKLENCKNCDRDFDTCIC